MRKFGRILFLGFVISFLITHPSWAASDPIRDALRAGGDRLVALQNTDGGWFFTVGDSDCGFGLGVSCPNTFGVTALGLVDSYRVVHDLAHLNAAVLAGDALVAKHAAAPACDANPATSADRPFTVDLTFLLDGLGRVVGQNGTVYRDVARDWFGCVMADFPNAADRADNRINGRIGQGLSNLGAWDASLDIRAALAVGERQYALDEARRIVARQTDWDVADSDCPGCELLSKGLFLAATETLRNDADIRAVRNQWKEDLLAVQAADGSWGGDVQLTAYVVMGLSATAQDPATQSAIDLAIAFLLSQQLSNGGFTVATSSTDENTEVNGEVLQALKAARFGTGH